MGCHFLLQEIFRTQGLNLGPLCPLQADSLPLSHLGGWGERGEAFDPHLS